MTSTCQPCHCIKTAPWNTKRGPNDGIYSCLGSRYAFFKVDNFYFIYYFLYIINKKEYYFTVLYHLAKRSGPGPVQSPAGPGPTFWVWVWVIQKSKKNLRLRQAPPRPYVWSWVPVPPPPCNGRCNYSCTGGGEKIN